MYRFDAVKGRDTNKHKLWKKSEKFDEPGGNQTRSGGSAAANGPIRRRQALSAAARILVRLMTPPSRQERIRAAPQWVGAIELRRRCPGRQWLLSRPHSYAGCTMVVRAEAGRSL